MKTLKIYVPEGYEIDKELSTFENIVFKEIKKELPKSWEKLEGLEGFFVDPKSRIGFASYWSPIEDYKKVFYTKEQAEASINLSMYSQLLQAYKDVSVTEFIDIAKEYEPKVRPILELFFGEYAEAAFYYGLLSKLRDEYRKGWKPDYTDKYAVKYGIYFTDQGLKIGAFYENTVFLVFQSIEVAEQFLENFRDLIEKAKPLMS
jgi:hypothetical protein